MLPENVIFIGVSINLFLSVWYIKTIVDGKTKPNLISWFCWMLPTFIGSFLQIRAGAGLSFLSTLMAGFGPFLVIIFSLFKKNAFWKINSFDIFCGFLSIFALILYFLTKNLAISIIFAILSDALAYVPTLIKSWKFPETESSTTYIGGIVNNLLAILIIKNWSFSIYSFPIYLVLSNLITVCFIYRKKIFKSY